MQLQQQQIVGSGQYGLQQHLGPWLDPSLAAHPLYPALPACALGQRCIMGAKGTVKRQMA